MPEGRSQESSATPAIIGELHRPDPVYGDMAFPGKGPVGKGPVGGILRRLPTGMTFGSNRYGWACRCEPAGPGASLVRDPAGIPGRQIG